MELLQVGEVVEANEGFFFYDAYFPKGYKFEIEPQHVGHAFEKWVTKVKCVMCKQVLYSNRFEYFEGEVWCKSCFEQESDTGDLLG
ncbi:hypothetical protein [Lysinibacillus pakistanensis]|uniref:Uncharacterized protein n=1 Tax=Lysinibacillus pakistanensis TaxID=759811 RepID=A0AAX3X001_9BACI|nr:hypothetical protein [Lysinibacillus pakistanensis]MDM5231468.1 hypothetical protein [Lysinibacillus pakistanensis]WHY47015.1 hypothetical protein QNH22_02005 [Lysinibacillus pakistanensis]WHY52027.1 hypothetical protein QNH24_02000 [Lysinibacillus pakistanensis]